MNFSVKQKTILLLRNYFTENRLKLVGYDFGYELADHIATGNGSEVSKVVRSFFFRIRAKKVELKDPQIFLDL